MADKDPQARTDEAEAARRGITVDALKAEREQDKAAQEQTENR